MNQLPPLGGPKDKFTPELRILVASLLSMGVILLWAKYFGPKPPVHPPQQDKPAISAPATAGKRASWGTGATVTPPAATTKATMTSTAAPVVPATADAAERTIVVENA